MKGQEKIKLKVGDEIGFVTLGNTADEKDAVQFRPVAEVTMRDGERAYRYQFPDGTISRAAVRQSDLASHVFRVHKNNVRAAQFGKVETFPAGSAAFADLEAA